MLLLQDISSPETPAEYWWLGALAAMGTAVFTWFRKRGEGVDQATMLYALVPIPFFALCAWAATAIGKASSDPLMAYDFLALQLFALLAGIAHAVLFHREVAGWRALLWPERTRRWSWSHFWFTILLLLSAMIGIMLASVLPFTGVVKGWQLFPALLTFLVPFLWVKAFDLYIGIPVAVYRPWYPTLEYHNYEWSPKFPKATLRLVFDDDRELVVENVPFDREFPFESMFQWVLHADLQDEPDTYYAEQGNATYVWGWHFHRQRTSWFRWNRRIDPLRTFCQSRIRNGDTIIALRDPKQEHLDVVHSALRKPRTNSTDA